MPLKSTTRHIQIYAAVVDLDNDELIDSENTLTLDVDPDNELNWTD
ncbi:MAG: NAD(P)H-quinone oxidoreductase subunit M, partial [Pseudanabaena sp.]